jgi:hypothetical protein
MSHAPFDLSCLSRHLGELQEAQLRGNLIKRRLQRFISDPALVVIHDVDDMLD